MKSNGSRTASGTLGGLALLPRAVRDIALLRGLGYPWREIGARLGKSSKTCARLLEEHRRLPIVLENRFGLTRLSVRAANVLGRHGISSPEQARKCNLASILHKERNCGAKTLEEITSWMAEYPCASALRTREGGVSGQGAPRPLLRIPA